MAIRERGVGRVAYVTGQTHSTTKPTRACSLLAALLALFLISCSSVSSQAGKSLPGVANFGWIDQGKVARSAQPDLQGYQTLKGMKFQSIGNLRADWDEWDAVINAGMTPYMWIVSLTDPPSVEQLAEWVKVMADPYNQPFLVHCQRGADRTGLMAASYEIIIMGKSYNEVKARMDSYIPEGKEMYPAISQRLIDVAKAFGRYN